MANQNPQQPGKQNQMGQGYENEDNHRERKMREQQEQDGGKSSPGRTDKSGH